MPTLSGLLRVIVPEDVIFAEDYSRSCMENGRRCYRFPVDETLCISCRDQAYSTIIIEELTMLIKNQLSTQQDIGSSRCLWTSNSGRNFLTLKLSSRLSFFNLFPVKASFLFLSYSLPRNMDFLLMSSR